MLASELRVGNLLEDDIGNVIVIDNDNLSYIVTKWIKCHHPIPLTEEWLLKFGFIKSVYTTCFDCDYFELTKTDNNWWSIEKDGVRLCLVKYVHQLQNLYFALTGKELEY